HRQLEHRRQRLLNPRQIVFYFPQDFQNEEEIYRLKRNIMERIMRNIDKIRWKLDGASKY
ncbi:MAG: hypothetical protein IMW89_19820, partial [Ktedonobacteraceae bacterium]|nr:hypothetical protein [Ktedonobacteraceae bacterium]